ncbi:DCN1-like protein 5 [Linnemannia gamsii]|uniref:Defective in cullin neddylation protein n=1 Tax=Linnemannia gamsii TaxID=64522 RepID=A0A9P6QRI9_9FUNG|nr:DCN1-like protein 5 [Linnemannia gamsii]
MPPKRKNTETAMGDNQAAAKTAKTATTAAAGGGATKEKKHKSKPTKAQAKAAAADLEAKASLEDDEDFDREQIGPAGIAKLCEDIDVSLETVKDWFRNFHKLLTDRGQGKIDWKPGVDMLVLAFHLEADTMPIFTKDEWAKGMKKLEVDSVERLKAKMASLVERLKDPTHFKEFYRYIFMFAKDSEQKCMPVDTACAMISTVMKGRPHELRFVEYLGVKKPIKVINKDQWYNFLDFSETISEDLSNYDGLSSAWPVLLDEYVEWRNEESA